MTQYILNADLLNGVALARGIKEPNSKLNNVYVWDEGESRCYMATNGHRLFMAREKRIEDLERIDMISILYDKSIKNRSDRAVLNIFDDAGHGVIMTDKDKKSVIITGEEPLSGCKSISDTSEYEDLTVFTLFKADQIKATQDFLGDSYFRRPKCLKNDGYSPVCWEMSAYGLEKKAILMPARMV